MVTDARPYWFLPANHIAVKADRKAQPKDVTHWCREGDAAWIPMGAEKVSAPADPPAPAPAP